MKIIKFETAKTGMLLIELNRIDSFVDFEKIAKDWCKEQGQNCSGEDIYEFVERSNKRRLMEPEGKVCTNDK